MGAIDKISKSELNRRGVLKGMGASAGLTLMVGLAACERTSDTAQKSSKKADPDASFGDDLFLKVSGDGTVHITIHRQEMGQGTRTGIPQIIADELDADWSRLNFIQGLGDKRFGDQNTDGSTSIRTNFDRLRRVGATARLMLRQAAAGYWGVPLDKVTAENHVITNTETGEYADYGAFADLAGKQKLPKSEQVLLKDRAEWRYINKPKQIVDMQGIITGTADFGQDVQLDGMVYAVVARPPVVGGSVKSYDRDAAMAVKGVIDVIELPSFELPAGFKPVGGIAVIAENTWAAIKGRKALDAQYDAGANKAYDSDTYEKTLWGNIDKGGRKALKRGDVEAGIKAAAKTMSSDYYVPHLVHAPMEPLAATAAFADDGTLDVYTHGQDPQSVQSTVAPYTGGLKPEVDQIRVHSKLLGGAFGRKSKPDFAAEAVILAKQLGKPVKVVWTREDEVQHGFYHAVSAQRVDVGMDEAGKVTSWRHRAAYPSIMYTFNGEQDEPVDFELSLGLLDIPFECDNLQVEACKAPAHIRIGWLRSVTNIQQAFAIGSMVDEIAAERGVSPYDQWMDMIGSDRKVTPAKDGAKYGNYNQPLEDYPIDTARLKAVLAKVKDMSGYGKDMPKGRGMGIAVHRSFVTFTACVVEVAVDDKGRISTPRAWMAVDCGIAVNPDRVKAQMEGAVNFGLSIAKYGKITIKDGAVMQGNFDGYELVRMPEAPQVEVAIIDNDAKPGGVGEPGVPPVAPAFTAALYQASGKRFKRLPVGTKV